MYNLAMGAPAADENFIPGQFVQNLTSSPLGGVSIAGFIRDSSGVSDTPMRILGSYALVYVLAGGGFYLDPTGPRRPVRAGDLIVLLPGVPHAYGPTQGSRWDELYLIFDGAIFDAWRAAGLFGKGGPQHHLEPIGYWQQRIATAAGTPQDEGPAAGLASACRVQQLLAEAIATSTAKREGTEAIWAEQAKELLNALAQKPVDQKAGLLVASREMGMSYEAFRKRFRRAVGNSPGRYLGARVIDRACRLLLADRSLTLATVANACGFCDAFHFSKRFKQLVGVSPADFRRRVSAILPPEQP